VDLYRQELGCLPGLGFQEVHPQDRNSYKDFSITVDEGAFGMTRDALSQALAAENVDTRKYYDPPVHRQTAYLQFDHGAPLPNTGWLAAHSLSLPVWSAMEPEITLGICRAIQRLHAHRGKNI
jgi:dTDP-4-amino-4,6-dideoxygalactose transaminase